MMPKSVSTTEAVLLTADQVIERLLDANLRSVAATCVLPAVRSGHEWRFRRADLDDWIRRQGSATPPSPASPFVAASQRADKRPS
jgi:hypothetical protein